jgi:hypothetical protein
LKLPFTKGHPVPVPYDQRRRRREQLTEELPLDLRKWIALRHVETVAKFSPETQQRLAKAIKDGAKVPAAVRFLKGNPNATVDEVVQATGKRKRTEKKRVQRPSEPNHLILLADLLQTCFPDMPRATAEAMAGSDLLSEVLCVISAQQTCLASSHAQSDFFVVMLCGLALEMIKHLNQIISTKMIYRQALQQSGLDWPF